MAYPMYPQNYPQFPTYQPYQQPMMQTAPQVQQTMPQMGSSFQGGNNQTVQQPAQMMQQPVQSAAPITIRSEQEARDWPIAPGNSLTFINEGEGYVYTKTSLNQFDRPQFVKYKLVREDAVEAPTAPVAAPKPPATPMPEYALRADVDALRGEIMGEIEGFRARLDSLTTEKPAGKGKKKEGNNDD